MINTVARYEGFADWYDSVMNDPNKRADLNVSAHKLLVSLVEKGEGIALDIGCGTGIAAGLLRDLGYMPFGFDISGDQLRIASNRLSVAQGDSAQLPVMSNSVPLVYSTFTTTDWDDLQSAVNEIFRVLYPGGRYIDIGTHPCFYGGFSEAQEDGSVVQRSGYDTSVYLEPAHYKGVVRSRVGGWHRPIGEVINNLIKAGFYIEKIAESGSGKLPNLLGIVARKK